uniref:Uncharacterized protein n=1 Tax=Anguilla anguilla TaxID=7936 RepID=A0A0E9U8P6_ANGAN
MTALLEKKTYIPINAIISIQLCFRTHGEINQLDKP